jgi:metal-dependent hydrolase (beta-lactamase superfamily II)
MATGIESAPRCNAQVFRQIDAFVASHYHEDHFGGIRRNRTEDCRAGLGA